VWLDAQPRREPLAGQGVVAEPAAALEPSDRCVHDVGGPAAGGGVGQQRHPDPQLGQDVHLDRIQASRGRRGVGEHVRHLAGVLAGQDLAQAGDRRLVAGLSQPPGRHGGPRGVPQGG
jgi:hypothetical protein